jgi:YhcH/YjgK/YiaL family protein
MAYRTRGPDEALLESHRNYIDVQATLDGAEGIEWFPRDTLVRKQDYEPARDFELWHRPGPPPARADMVPGMFCVLFPEDAHMAQQIVGSTPRDIRKAVVKIRLNAL